MKAIVKVGTPLLSKVQVVAEERWSHWVDFPWFVLVLWLCDSDRKQSSLFSCLFNDDFHHIHTNDVQKLVKICNANFDFHIR